ncbi:MAG: hypothetical protein CMJ85_03810 [Planctomycetes bacterium]|nr:hypothetical protein [Planctomycetota bacterium]
MFLQMTEVALRGLVYMVDIARGRLVQSRQIGAHLGISGTYGAKAFQPLSRIAWLRSTRGVPAAGCSRSSPPLTRCSKPCEHSSLTVSGAGARSPTRHPALRRKGVS